MTTDLAVAIAARNGFPTPFLDPDVERDAVRAFRTLAMRLESIVERGRWAIALRDTGWTGRKPAFAGAAAREYREEGAGPRSAASEQHASREARATTVDAIMYELRENGAAAIKAPNCQARLRALTVKQLEGLLARLIALQPQYPRINEEVLKRIAKGTARKKRKGNSHE
jgi:hypothetical protein